MKANRYFRWSDLHGRTLAKCRIWQLRLDGRGDAPEFYVSDNGRWRPTLPITRPKLTPADLSTIRGANYRGAAAANTTDYWLHYNPAETERDLTYADR